MILFDHLKEPTLSYWKTIKSLKSDTPEQKLWPFKDPNIQCIHIYIYIRCDNNYDDDVLCIYTLLLTSYNIIMCHFTG